MTENQPTAKGPSPVSVGTPAPQATRGTLTIVDDEPPAVHLSLQGGTAIPASIPVVNEAGEVVAVYTAGAVPGADNGHGTMRAIMWTSEEVGLWGAVDYAR